jgi:hypothetical protein
MALHDGIYKIAYMYFINICTYVMQMLNIKPKICLTKHVCNNLSVQMYMFTFTQFYMVC